MGREFQCTENVLRDIEELSKESIPFLNRTQATRSSFTCEERAKGACIRLTREQISFLQYCIRRIVKIGIQMIKFFSGPDALKSSSNVRRSVASRIAASRKQPTRRWRIAACFAERVRLP